MTSPPLLTSNNFQTLTITSHYPATQVVYPDGIPVQLLNLDPNNIVYLGSNNAIEAGDLNNTIPLHPNGSYIAGGNISVFAICSSGQSVQLVRAPDAINFTVPPTLSGIGGSGIYVQPTAPVGAIPLNSIWFNTTLGALEYWNGSAWVIQAFAGNELITAGTIITNLLIAGFFQGYEIDGAIFRAKNSFGATIMTINKTATTWILYQDTASATQGMVVASGNNSSSPTTDEFSNSIIQGIASYGGVSGAWTAITMDVGGSIAFFTSTSVTQVGFTPQGSMAFGASQPIIFSNGGFHVQVASPDQLLLGAGQGPFISGESFHAVTLPSTGGFSGSIRVKKLPWNAIWLDVAVRWTGLTGTTYTCGSLPDSTYYPTANTPRFFPFVQGDTPNSDLLPNIAVPASGALTIFTNSSTSGSGTAGWYGCSVMYPTN